VFVDGHDSIKRVISTIKETRRRVIEEAPHDPSFYADPGRVMSHPFPLHNKFPRRFDMSNAKTFSFMGRDRFAEVWETWRKINGDTLHRQAMYIYGSMGYGKSHILAALVCLLICSGERVIYVPGCGQAFKESLVYMKTAFLFAFCDSPLDLEKIAAWRCLKDIEDFCVGFPGRTLHSAS
jgi:predicted ATPase